MRMRTPRRRAHALAAALAAAVMLAATAGCSSGGDEAPDAAASSPSSSSSSSSSSSASSSAAPLLDPLPEEIPDNLSSYYEQELDWTSCGPSGFECAELTVPMDYENPDPAEDIQLTVTRTAATGTGGTERIGSLLVNPGGPGASAVDFVQSSADYLFPAEVRASYDVVGLDARGTGSSEPVKCLSGEEMDEYTATDRTPDSTAETTALIDSYEEFAEACQDRSGELLEHISTIESARDMDVLRAVLGDEKLHYYGASYGTKLGAVYAGLYPQRAGRLVLDAAMDPSLSTLETDRGQAGGFETAFRSFAEDCATYDDCPLGTEGGDDASQALQSFFSEVDADPLATDDPDRPLTESLARTGVSEAMYADYLWEDLRSALSEAMNEGDGSGLLALADEYNDRRSNGTYGTIMNAFPAISCLDSPAASQDAADVRSILASYEEESPTFGTEFAWATLQCGVWDVEPSGQPVTIKATGADDILVIGTTRDPATPYEWSESLTDQLDSGILLTYESDGHGAYAMGSTCIDESVNAYLLDGTTPEEGTTCP